MSASEMRPPRGFPPQEALERWSDKKLYADMMEFIDAREDCSGSIQLPPTPYMLRHKEYRRRRDALEDAFLQKLRDRILVASAIAEWASAREVIDPSLWDVLWVDYKWGEINGDRRTYKKPEFFEPPAVPLNVTDPPEWLKVPVSKGFTHDATYRHVALGDLKFTFGPLCAKVVKLLHEAVKADDGWQNGKKILAQAGSRQTKMHDVFKSQKHWQALIESDGSGQYRLRLD